MSLIIASVAVLGYNIKAYHLEVLNHRLNTAQLIQWRPLIITVVIVTGLVAPALWLCMARAIGQGRNGARIFSVVLSGVVTLVLAIAVFALGGPGHVAGMTVPSLVLSVLNWLIGLAAVCLLWLPASTAFFWPPGRAQARHEARMAERARIAAIRY